MSRGCVSNMVWNQVSRGSQNPVPNQQKPASLVSGDTWFWEGTCHPKIWLLIPPLLRKYSGVIVPEFHDTTFRAGNLGYNEMLHEKLGVDGCSQGYFHAWTWMGFVLFLNSHISENSNLLISNSVLAIIIFPTSTQSIFWGNLAFNHL